MKLWQKNIESLKEVEKFTVGNDREFDLQLAPFDVLGSIAHVMMLAEVGLLTQEEGNLLTKELKELEQHKLIKRVITPDYPVKITYQPEAYAATLTPIIYALKDWGLNHRQKIFGKD